MMESIIDVLAWIWKYWYVISIFLSIIIIFFQRNEPESVWAWLLVLYFVPFVGFFLYLFLHQDFNKRHMFRIKEQQDELNSGIYRRASRHERLLENISDPELEDFNQILRYNQRVGDATYSEDNSVEIIIDGQQKFDRLIEEIDKAEHYINLQYYIIQNDELFAQIRAHLYRKVREGVTVRLLYDPVGSRHMSVAVLREMREQGILVGNFFPALFGLLHIRINYRNHRKIVVIDGRVAFVGGYNIGREYISRDQFFGYWRDTHLILKGSSVLALQMRFALDWNYATKENLFLKPQMFKPLLRRGETALPPRGKVGIQIIASGPDAKEAQIRDTYAYMIARAKKSICIQTPYFIPDQTIKTALMTAIRSGVEVKLMIPCKPDHPFVYWATYSYMGDLLGCGARCYIYENGFLHAKGIIVDGKVACYGTANMDIRSFKLNFEVNAAIYDSEVAGWMERIYEEDCMHCREITWEEYGRRNAWVRFREQISRLLSPVL